MIASEVSIQLNNEMNLKTFKNIVLVLIIYSELAASLSVQSSQTANTESNESSIGSLITPFFSEATSSENGILEKKSSKVKKKIQSIRNDKMLPVSKKFEISKEISLLNRVKTVETLKQVNPVAHNQAQKEIQENESEKQERFYDILKVGVMKTDEIRNGLQLNQLAINPIHQSEAKVNIDDFFPSKDEDFKSTNEVKLIQDKTFIENGRLPSIFNSQKLNFEKNGSFIPKRSKKLNPVSLNTQGPQRINDFGMTKFSLKIENKSLDQLSNSKPEFSTTKFYNNKEVYSGSSHKVRNSLVPTISHTPNKNKANKKKNIEKSIATKTTEFIAKPTSHPIIPSRLEDKLNSIICVMPNLSTSSTVWRGNETHEINLPTKVSLMPSIGRFGKNGRS